MRIKGLILGAAEGRSALKKGDDRVEEVQARLATDELEGHAVCRRESRRKPDPLLITPPSCGADHQRDIMHPFTLK